MDENAVHSEKIHEDILVAIFSILAKDMDYNYIGTTARIWDWVCVTEVCRYWRAVAVETPVLWSYIHMFNSAKRTERLLLLSRDSSLTVYYGGMYTIRDREAAPRNLKAVLEEMVRIRRLYIELSESNCDDIHQLLSLLDKPAPRAASITLRLRSTFYKKIRLQLPLASSGILKRVSLYGMDLSSCLPYFSGLSFISIRSSINFSLFELQQVLEACPELVSLALDSCDVGSSSINRSVFLPYLSDLTLESMEFFICHSLIQSIEVPNLHRWKIKGGRSDDPDDVTRMGVFLKLLQGELNCKTIGIHANCYSEDQRGGMTWYDDFDPRRCDDNKRGDLEFSFGQSVGSNFILSCLTDTFKDYLEKAERLYVVVAEESVTIETWHRTFGAFDSVKTISLSLSSTSSYGLRFLKALSHPNPQILPIRMPFPHLENLDIHWIGWDSDLDKLLRPLESLVTSRSVHGLPVGKISVLSLYSVRENDGFKKLSKWVQELEWRTVVDV